MRADVVVVGAGLMGSAAAWSLSRRGREVIVLEAYEPAHVGGSSHGAARLFRRAYVDPLYAGLTAQAADVWHRLSDEAGENLIPLTGAVDFGPRLDAEKLYERLSSLCVSAQLLTAAEAGERWPGMEFGERPVLFHSDAGVFDPERAVAVMLRLAAASGAQLSSRAPVTRIEPDGTVYTAEQKYTADVVVVAAGPWLKPLLGESVPLPALTVSQTESFYFAPNEPEPAWPPFIAHDELSFYGLPAGPRGQAPVLKLGINRRGAGTTGQGRDGVVDPVARQRVRRFVQSTLPAVCDEPLRESSCLYTSTVNDDFLVDRYGRIVVCSACSRHGAKFAPLIGDIVADLACGAPTRYERFTLEAHLAAR
jgi:monomeric sarcosine oxidase